MESVDVTEELSPQSKVAPRLSKVFDVEEASPLTLPSHCASKSLVPRRSNRRSIPTDFYHDGNTKKQESAQEDNDEDEDSRSNNLAVVGNDYDNQDNAATRDEPKLAARRLARQSIPADVHHNDNNKEAVADETSPKDDSRNLAVSGKNDAKDTIIETRPAAKRSSRRSIPTDFYHNATEESFARDTIAVITTTTTTLATKKSTTNAQSAAETSSQVSATNASSDGPVGSSASVSIAKGNDDVASAPANDVVVDVSGEESANEVAAARPQNNVVVDVSTTRSTEEPTSNTGRRSSSRRSVPTDFYIAGLDDLINQSVKASKHTDKIFKKKASPKRPRKTVAVKATADESSGQSKEQVVSSAPKDKATTAKAMNPVATAEALHETPTESSGRSTEQVANPKEKAPVKKRGRPRKNKLVVTKETVDDTTERSEKSKDQPESPAPKEKAPVKRKRGRPRTKEPVAVKETVDETPMGRSGRAKEQPESPAPKEKAPVMKRKSGRPRTKEPVAVKETVDETPMERSGQTKEQVAGPAPKEKAPMKRMRGWPRKIKPVVMEETLDGTTTLEIPEESNEQIASSVVDLSDLTPPSKRKKRRVRVIPSSLRKKSLSTTSSLVLGIPMGQKNDHGDRKQNLKAPGRENNAPPKRISSHKLAMNYKDGKIESILGADVSDACHTTRRSQVIVKPKAKSKPEDEVPIHNGQAIEPQKSTAKSRPAGVSPYPPGAKRRGRPPKRKTWPPRKQEAYAVKHGRGRPRKNPQPDSSDAEPPVEPRKNPLPEPNVEQPSVDELKQRGPGRPREHPLPDVAAEPKKRGPGRPRKNPALQSDVENPVVEPEKGGPGRPRKHPLPEPALENPDVEPKKRGPGRPRKHPLVEPDTDQPKKIGPGRPRKHPLPDPAGTKPSAVAQIKKRGPGRPRKHPLPTQSGIKRKRESVESDSDWEMQPQNDDDDDEDYSDGDMLQSSSEEDMSDDEELKRNRHVAVETLPASDPAEAAPPATQIKRGRGRPRKHPLPSLEPDATGKPPVESKRRGPGRPRKNPLPTGEKQQKRRGRPPKNASRNDAAGIEEGIEVAKQPRRRGRPPKQTTLEMLVEEDDTITKQPRKRRGRPPKQSSETAAAPKRRGRPPRRTTRDCGTCLVCRKGVNCGRCKPCLNMIEFGGDGSLGAKCILRVCVTPIIVEDGQPVVPVGAAAASLETSVAGIEGAPRHSHGTTHPWCDSGVESLSDNDSMAVDDMSDMEWEEGYDRDSAVMGFTKRASLSVMPAVPVQTIGNGSSSVQFQGQLQQDAMTAGDSSVARVSANVAPVAVTVTSKDKSANTTQSTAPPRPKDAAELARNLLRHERMQFLDEDDSYDGSSDEDDFAPPPPPLDFDGY